LKNTIAESLKPVINEIEKSIGEIEQKEFPGLAQTMDTDVLKSKPSDFNPYYSDIREKERKWYSFGIGKWSKDYSYSEQKEYLNSLKDYFIENIPAKLQEYRDILRADFIAGRDRFIENLKSQINGYAEQYAAEQEKAIEKLNREINRMNEMLSDLKK